MSARLTAERERLGHLLASPDPEPRDVLAAIDAVVDAAEESGAIVMRDCVAESMRRAADDVSADLPGLAAMDARDQWGRCDAVVRTTRRYSQNVQALDAAEVCRAARARATETVS